MCAKILNTRIVYICLFALHNINNRPYLVCRLHLLKFSILFVLRCVFVFRFNFSGMFEHSIFRLVVIHSLSYSIHFSRMCPCFWYAKRVSMSVCVCLCVYSCVYVSVCGCSMCFACIFNENVPARKWKMVGGSRLSLNALYFDFEKWLKIEWEWWFINCEPWCKT